MHLSKRRPFSYGLMRRINFDRGLSSEAAIPWAIENAKHILPSWIVLPIERASMALDFKHGIDYIVNTTDVGKIYIQVKSSELLAEKFRNEKGKYRRFTGIVVVDQKVNTPEEICLRVIRALEPIHEMLLRMRGQVDRSLEIASSESPQ